MEKTLYVIVVVGFALFSANVLADTLQGSAAAGWQSWTSAVLNANGLPYWDGASFDGSQRNIGYYLTNTGFFAGGTGPGIPLNYWGNSNGTADLSFYFNREGSSLAAIKLEIAGYKTSNVFGWYEKNTGTRHQLFAGIDSTGASAFFTPTAEYGFYITSPEGTFKTGNGASYQHFAVFQDTVNGFWIGVEDLSSSRCSDKDYNDIVVRISQVPEPTTLLLLGLGLTGFVGVRRRLKD